MKGKAKQKSWKKKCIVLLSRSALFSLCIVIAVALRLSASLCEFSVWLLTTSTTVRCLGVLLTWAQSSYLRQPTTDSGLPTTTTTPTPRVVSINPCRRQGAAAAAVAALPAVCTALVNSVCGFHCGYLSWMCPCLTIYRSLRVYWVCVRGGLYCQSVYLSICLFVWLPGCRVYRIVFALQIHRHEKCSFVHLYWFFSSLSSIKYKLSARFSDLRIHWTNIQIRARFVYDYGA